MLKFLRCEMFQGISNKVKEDLESFFMGHSLDIEKIKISQSETEGKINLTLIY